MLIVQDQESGAIYTHHCVRCGNCCKSGYTIVIREGDVNRWVQESRHDITKGICIDLKSLAPAALIPLPWYASHPLDQYNDPIGPELAFIDSHQAVFEELKKVLLDNHEIIYNKGTSKESFISFWIIPDMDFRAVLVPKTLEILKDGIARGIRYVINMVPDDGCRFLVNNSCSIHDTKPEECAGYPVKEHLEQDPRAMKKCLAICKGMEKQEQA